jgi:hypothetical protein
MASIFGVPPKRWVISQIYTAPDPRRRNSSITSNCTMANELEGIWKEIAVVTRGIIIVILLAIWGKPQKA